MRAESKKGWRVAAKYWESEGHKLEAQLASQDALLEEAVELIKAMSPYLVSERDANMGRDEVMGLRSKKRLNEVRAMKDAFLTSRNHIVLGWHLLPDDHPDLAGTDGSHGAEAVGRKEHFDDLHKRKIDLADEILVLNFGVYIGESTRSEIEYAKAHGKPIRLIEDGNKETCALDGRVYEVHRHGTGKKPEAEARKENSENPNNFKPETGGAK